MAVSTKDVLKLREMTSCGMVDCKEALTEAAGNFDKAVELLRKKGKATAESKAARSTGEGLIEAYIHGTGRVGVLVEINCETDFVAKNDKFKEFAHEIAMQIAAMNPDTVPELLEQPYIKDEKLKIADLLTDLIGKTGENVKIRRFTKYIIGGE